MRRSIYLLFASVALAVGAVSPASAFTLSIVPQSTQIAVGSTFSVDVMASGLIDAAAPSLGAYDLDFTFDSSLLSFADATFGTGLDVSGLGSLRQVDSSTTTGHLNLFELSFDSIADLNQLQSDAFKLFTLTFNAASAGTSPLALAVNSLGDAEGNALSADLNNSSVNVSPVPLPAALWLLLSALAGAWSWGWVRRPAQCVAA